VNSIRQQCGIVMIFALLMLLCLTILGVASVSSSLLQTKMASSQEQQFLAFNAAEGALSEVLFEMEEQLELSTTSLLNPLLEARKISELVPSVTGLSCFVKDGFIQSNVTSAGPNFAERHTTLAQSDSQYRLTRWSRIAFVQEQTCRGSSNVIGANKISCHMFVVRGCGQLENSPFAVANSMTVSVFAPTSQ
jgi:type IV pilus assembly protein PilX